jgi:hypothetical protein
MYSCVRWAPGARRWRPPCGGGTGSRHGGAGPHRAATYGRVPGAGRPAADAPAVHRPVSSPCVTLMRYVRAPIALSSVVKSAMERCQATAYAWHPRGVGGRAVQTLESRPPLGLFLKRMLCPKRLHKKTRRPQPPPVTERGAQRRAAVKKDYPSQRMLGTLTDAIRTGPCGVKGNCKAFCSAALNQDSGHTPIGGCAGLQTCLQQAISYTCIVLVSIIFF